jgi:hypothetical protein
MSFVLVLRGAEGGARSAQLAARLNRLGYDVCVAPNAESPSVRAGVLRSLSSQCACVAAVWSKADLDDPALLETLGDAAAQGKLIAASSDGERFPALAGTRGAIETANHLEAMVEAVVRRARPGGAHRVAEEYAAFQRALSGGAGAHYERFIRQYPEGVFAALARVERGLAAHPEYQPHKGALENPAWRLERRPAFGVMAAAAALVMVAGVAALSPGSALLDNVLRLRPAGVVSQPVYGEAVVAPNTRPLDSAPLSATEISNAQPLAPTAQPEISAADLPVPRARTNAASGPATSVSQPSASPVLSPGERPLTNARASRLPRLNGFDASALDPSLRTIVEQARRRQAYARAEAARDEEGRTLSTGGGATYQGDWSGNHASGLGRARWSDGGLYEGSWRRSRPDGMGVMEMASGVRYEGEFNNGAPTGRGVFWSAHGEPLSGSRLFGVLIEAQRASAPSADQSAR